MATKILRLTSLQPRLHHDTLSTGVLILPRSYLHFSNRIQFCLEGEGGGGGRVYMVGEGGGGGY